MTERIWLKSYPQGVPTDIDPSMYPSLVGLMEESFSKYAGRTAYSFMGRDVKSGYLEVFVPVVGASNARSGIQDLSLSGAVRYDDYSDFGGTLNPKFALRYVPVDGLTFRGTFGTSFRAPTLSDIDVQALTISVQDFVDPSGPGGVTRTLWVRGGNDQLGPERATIWSLGADYEPAFLSGLNLSLTYFNVNYRDRIETRWSWR